MHRVKIYLGSILFFFYQGIVRTVKMSFYKWKMKFEISGTAYSTENFRFRTENFLVFWLKQAYSQPASECGLIEEKLSARFPYNPIH